MPRPDGPQWLAPLFHGTNVRLERGDIILPQRVLGVDSPTLASNDYSSQDSYFKPIKKSTYSDSELAHASEKAFVSALYADRAVEHLGGSFNLYRVAPIKRDVKRILEDEVASPSGFRIVRRLPIESSTDPRLRAQWQQVTDRYGRWSKPPTYERTQSHTWSANWR